MRPLRLPALVALFGVLMTATSCTLSAAARSTRWRWILSLLLFVAACSTGRVAQQGSIRDSLSADATRLPTGVRLDPAGVVHPVGPMPLNIAIAPGGNRAVLLL